MKALSSRVAIVVMIVGSAIAFPAVPAVAHCHSFTFGKGSYTVSEGAGSVTVTVNRDGSYADSSIQYSTEDNTAKAGQDYTARSGTLSYTGSELSKDIVIPIINDTKHENSEEFGVRLHDPAGCDTPYYQYPSSPVSVTILDDDPKPTPTPTHASPKPTSKATTAPHATPTHTASPKPTRGPTSTPSPAPSRTTIAVAPTGYRGGISGGALAGIVAAIIVAGGAAAVWVRKRLLSRA